MSKSSHLHRPPTPEPEEEAPPRLSLAESLRIQVGDSVGVESPPVGWLTPALSWLRKAAHQWRAGEAESTPHEEARGLWLEGRHQGALRRYACWRRIFTDRSSTQTHMYAHTLTRMHAHSRAHLHVCVCTHAQKHTHICIYMVQRSLTSVAATT